MEFACMCEVSLVGVEEFGDGGRLVAAGARAAVADEVAGPVAVVAPLAGDVALAALAALADAGLPAGMPWRVRCRDRRGLAAPECFLPACRGAVALAAYGGEWRGADGAARGRCCRHATG